MEQTVLLERKKVYDPVLRTLHAVIGLSIFVLMATALGAEGLEKGGAEKTAWMFHIYAGYALGAGLAGRIIWGLVGPKSASLKELWHPRAWLGVLKKKMPEGREFGHDPMASAAYLAFYALAAVMVVTGISLAGAEHGTGPLAPWLLDSPWVEEVTEEPHELIAWLILGFIVLHLGALLWHERKEQRPLAQAMISGYQYRRIDTAKRVLLFFAAALLVAPAAARAETPNSILDGYAQQAQKEDPAFSGFSAERGKELYFAVHQTPDGPMACTSCHTDNAAAAGKTSAGKTIKPLAKNPERFTDTKKVEKWFRRNCNDVLQRVCTTREKGDFIQYILSVR